MGNAINLLCCETIGDSKMACFREPDCLKVLIENETVPDLNKEWIFGKTLLDEIIWVYWCKNVKSILIYHENHKDEPIPYICDDTNKIMNMAKEAVRTCLF